jgi:hypothetical protein
MRTLIYQNCIKGHNVNRLIGDNVALPISTETERSLYLRGIVEAAAGNDVMAWPKPNDDDYVLFARIIHFYNSIDFSLRYTVDIMDHNGMLRPPWKGKTAKLNMYKVSKAIRSCDIWNEGHKVGFDQIELHRRARNLIAHFVVRRFPTEDAFIFMTMSAADFEQVYGVLPERDSMLFGVVDADQMRGIIPVLQGLISWCSKLPGNLSNPLNPDVAE